TEAGIDRHVTPHMLRHTVATLLLRNGVDIRVVQEFLGHASIATTQRYTHVSKEHLRSVLTSHHPSLTLRGKKWREEVLDSGRPGQPGATTRVMRREASQSVDITSSDHFFSGSI